MVWENDEPSRQLLLLGTLHEQKRRRPIHPKHPHQVLVTPGDLPCRSRDWLCFCVSFSGDNEARAKSAQIGYVLGSNYWGKGIATKAVKMVVEMAFVEFPNLERLEALVDVENVASQRVLEKAGFQREGILRKFLFIKGKSRDMVMFSLLSDEV